ncbi:hypothetical protein [Pyrococcus kukulkanii]|uniref:Uncharacterized protein n=1 Tax=Pyrococcus kukulkanii TaxID=1609559 RepID=A0ABV4T5W5_9EURY
MISPEAFLLISLELLVGLALVVYLDYKTRRLEADVREKVIRLVRYCFYVIVGRGGGCG